MTDLGEVEPYFVGYDPVGSAYPSSPVSVIEGDPSGLRSAAQYYADTATVLETLATDVRAAANRSQDVWDGDTAPVARTAVRGTSARIHALVQPVRDVAAAHTTLADTLEHLQGRVEDYWDSAKRTHLPQYARGQWMSGLVETDIDYFVTYQTPTPEATQDASDLRWLKSEIFLLKAAAAEARCTFYTALVDAQAACDVIDPTWALVEDAPALVEPPAPAPVEPAPPLPAPPSAGPSSPAPGGGGGDGGGGRGAPALPPLDVSKLPELPGIPEIGETVLPLAPPESPETTVDPENAAPAVAAEPALAPVSPELVSPVPPAAWAAEQVAVRESLGGAPWTIQDDAGWSELVRADVGLQADLAARNAEVAADAVQRFLETGATGGTFDLVPSEPAPAPAAPTLADRLGGLPAGTATDAVDPGLLHHHGSTTVTRLDDGTFSVTLDVAYEWSDQIAPDATFAVGSWQDGAAGILTGGDAPYDLSVAWGSSATVALDAHGLVLSTTPSEPR